MELDNIEATMVHVLICI